MFFKKPKFYKDPFRAPMYVLTARLIKFDSPEELDGFTIGHPVYDSIARSILWAMVQDDGYIHTADKVSAIAIVMVMDDPHVPRVVLDMFRNATSDYSLLKKGAIDSLISLSREAGHEVLFAGNDHIGTYEKPRSKMFSTRTKA